MDGTLNINQFPDSYLKIGLKKNGTLSAVFVKNGVETEAVTIGSWEGDIIVKGIPVIEAHDHVESKPEEEQKELFDKIRKGFS